MTFAIVGRGCVLPGALDPASLWELALHGRDAIGPVPEGRWRIAPERAMTNDPKSASDRTWSDRGGYVRGLAFDPSGFAVDRAGELDPLFQWTLHAGREALREAGLYGAGRRAGAILGNLSFPTASHARFAEEHWRGLPRTIDPRERFHSGLSLIAPALDLRGGPSFALDAACASSLYAIALACDALADRRADVMLAGAVNCTDDLFIHIGFCALDAMSKSGRSRPFHPEADGLVPAEGAAVVALMRLEDARKEGRRIFGVVRAVGLANDGRAKSFLAPAEAGQARAMRAAYRKSGLAPSDIGWIECHATGTSIGDATEIASTSMVLGDARVAAGSLKANLGHAITTAGAAGLLKVLGAMEARVYPPTPHLDRTIETGALRIVRSAEEWTGPRRAAISAFGFGGNDAHLIVEAEDVVSAGSLPPPSPLPRNAGGGEIVPPSLRRNAGDIAVVGIGARVGPYGSAQAFADALRTDRGGRRATEVRLPLEALRTPPSDLASSLAQQTMLLSAALDAAIPDLDPDRTAVLVGMQCDSEIARHGVRWRADDASVDAESFAPPLRAPAVLGTMPNIPANRVNRELDLRGPSYTVSADELSGIRALELAMRALSEGELDAALVGAVDLACEPVHEAAAREVLGIERGGDAAIVLTLMRLEDARAKKRPVLAVIEAPSPAPAASIDLRERFGHAHAASGLLQVAAAALTAGERVRVSIDALGGRRAEIVVRPGDGAFDLSGRTPERLLMLPAHPPPPRVVVASDHEVLERAPELPPARDAGALAPQPEDDSPPPVLAPRRVDPPRANAPLIAQIEAHQRHVTSMHEEFLRTQSALHQEFIAGRTRALSALTRQAPPSAPSPPSPPVREPSPPGPLPLRERGDSRGAGKARGLTPNTPPPAPIGRGFSRAELEVHASGRISEIFGAPFAEQDAHAVQVRMPEPPLLLADRVTGIDGVPLSMGKGSVWTETDVAPEAFYLHAGRMPAGLMIESGQADLFLISYLGADLLNRGERRYRLLGCKLTWHRSPPRIGETLAYDIHVDGHAKQGGVRLFFFHYDCHIDGQPALTVRSGQAGFFTEEELAESAGVLWSPEEMEIAPGARLDPALALDRSSFDEAQIAALSAGDAYACFGRGLEATRSHVRTPTIAGGRLLLFDRVTALDPRGGPHGRGYLRATMRVSPDAWFFDGHFKNDPCMPGTLMLDGCLSAMAFYLIGAGVTRDRDGWRFEPIPDETYDMICRGQVIPTSEELVYELFVSELHDGPIPKLYADLLCSVDGRKAFHAKRLGLQLVPDFPFEGAPDEEGATLDGLRLGKNALLSSALGRPSAAFGPRYAIFDELRRAPRLPGPPYHMVSRVVRVEGEPWTKKPGARVEIAYDVPPDAWYLEDGACGAMPYSLLLEAALQPCGWLATYVGSTLDRAGDLRFRNLDGEGQVLGEVRGGALITRATLTSISDTASMVIVAFDVTTSEGDRDVYRLKTTFGFFPDAAFEGQAGLPVSDAQRALLGASGRSIAIHPLMQRGRLSLLDEIPFFDPEGGRAGLGAARAESAVDPSAWFFKAHFFQDPVQPGSLGMEAMLALLRAVMIEKGLARGLRDPRFVPIAHRPHRWKYRGQVRPNDRRIAVTLELTAIEGREARAEASFWIDGKRIYEAELALAIEGEPEHGRWDLDRDAIARFWDARLGIGGTIAEDLALSLLSRFVRRVHADPALDRLTTPVLYAANHQTAIETLLFSMIAGAASGIPAVTVAKAEHRTSWLGELLAWIFAHPCARERELTAYFDRDDAASLPALLRSLPRDRSILLHVEGTRATSCRDRIERMSGVPIEIAIERGMPIVPVRFTGALPIEPAAGKLDFPVGMGSLDVWIGAPLDVAALGYKERIDRVRDAILALGTDEAPNDGDPDFATEVAKRMSQTGVALAEAAFFCALREHASPSAATRQTLSGALPDDPWAASFAQRLIRAVDRPR